MDDIALDELVAFMDALTEPVPRPNQGQKLFPPKGSPFELPDVAKL